MAKLEVAIAFGLLAVTGGALAQGAYIRPAYQFPAPPSGSDPASVHVPGTPLFLAPYVGVAVGHDDNLFLSSQNEKSSSLYITSPGFRLDARDANKVFQFGYQAQIGRYTGSHEDDYNDQTANGQFDMAIDRRNFLRLGLNYIRSHDPRGSTDRPFGERPDRYELTNPYATYAFGAPGAAGRIELYASAGDKRYKNNREFTVASDRDTREYGGIFYWRAMPQTRLLAELRRTNLDYKLTDSPLGGDETRYYAGVTWEATAATTGTVKVGRLKRDFDTSLFPGFSGNTWEALVSWSPRTYSRFDFYTARLTSESTGLGSFILTSVSGVAWNHAWSSFISTGVDLRYQKDDYQGFNRNDETGSLGLKVGYKFRRWLTLGAEYTYTHRDSNITRFEYDRNVYFVTANASL